ncbi:type 2 periplasmic-binding domain-containing protein [Nautilia lithotrophica]
MKKIYIIFFLFIFFVGCSEKRELKIAANSWIGYIPLFYADKKGWLKNEKIKLITTVSLAESLDLYKNNFVNAFAATQYEYSLLNRNDVYAIMLFDRSNGADMILSNFSFKDLKNKQIDAYMEVNSVNYLLFQYFLKANNLNKNNFYIHNLDQGQIVKKKYTAPSLIVTYAPYDAELKKQNFKIIASTKDSSSLIVIDALFSDAENIYLHKRQFLKVKEFSLKALRDLKKDPREFFKNVKDYLPGYSYEDFKADLKNIEWIIKPDKHIKNLLKKINLPYKELK